MIQRIYNDMWDRFKSSIAQKKYEFDPYILDPEDNRRGITALAYIGQNSQKVADEISSFQEAVKEIEPHQYYHPVNELHLTALSIITCIDSFQLTDVQPQEYVDIFNEVVSKIEPIEIEYRGITGSPNCILIQGFPVGYGLE